MVFFRCTVGGGKGNTVTVTCAEEFAGLTITLAKTGKTYTKTCPSTSPYVVTFYGVENGTYTVSCTVDGQTYSETVIVQDISCVLNYGFAWKLWVDTASQLDSSDYDTLDEVLADEKALRELFLEHACVDYMASVAASNEDLETVINNDLCAKWINLSDYALDFLHANEVIADLMDEADKYFYGEWVSSFVNAVPKMTSATTPSGTVISSYVGTSGREPYKAFDQDSSTFYEPQSNQSSNYIGYTFVEPIVIRHIHFICQQAKGSASSVPERMFYVQASNDGFVNDINLLGSFSISSVTATTTRTIDVDIDNNDSYLSYRLFCNDITHVSNSYVYNFMILEFNVEVWAPKGNVPVMTSTTAPYGTVIGASGNNYYYAFDNDSTTYSGATQNAVNGYCVGYTFTNPVNVKKFMYINRTATPTYAVRQFKIQASNGSTWIDLTETLINTKPNSAEPFYVDLSDNDAYYLSYRMYVFNAYDGTSTTASTTLYCNVGTVQFYGRELKVSVPVMTSNNAPFGVASASSILSATTDAWYAFAETAKNSKSLWATAAGVATNSWLAYEFTESVEIRKAYVENRNDEATNQGAKVCCIQYYDGTDWQDATDDFTVPQSGNITVDIEEEIQSNKWRLYARDNYGNTVITVRKLQFYGLDYSEKEFEAGTTKKWLYDHGVELETIIGEVGSGGTTPIKESNQLYMEDASTKYPKFYSSVSASQYALMRIKLGNKFYGTSNSTTPYIVSASGGTAVAQKLLYNDTSSFPYNVYLDVSNDNSSDRVLVVDVGTSSTKTYWTVAEWWLE